MDAKEDTNSINNDIKNTNNNSIPQDTRKRIVKYLSSRTSGLSSASTSSSSGDWCNYNEDDEEFIRKIPKVELHVHLDGAFDPDYLWNYIEQHSNRDDIAQRYPKEFIPPWDIMNQKTLYLQNDIKNCKNSNEYHKLCTCRGQRSLAYMLNCFQYFLPLVSNQLELIEQLSYDFVVRQYEQNIIYTEVRYSPHELCVRSEHQKQQNENDIIIITADMIVQTVTNGLRRGIDKYSHLIINQILCAITWHPEYADDVVELAIKYRNNYPCAVVAIDIAAGEEHFNSIQFPNLYTKHYDMCQKAKLYQIPITLHAGETSMSTNSEGNTTDVSSNVKRAIDEYGATRIGHGYHIVHDVELMKYVKEKNIHFEICPTSSDETGGWDYNSTDNNVKDWSKHPAVILYKDNNITNITINSDDPAVFHTSLSWQYRITLIKMKHFTKKDLILMNINAIQNAAFGLSISDKQYLLQYILQFAQLYNIEIENIQDNYSKTENDLIGQQRTTPSESSSESDLCNFVETATPKMILLPNHDNTNIDDYFRDRVYIENELF